MEIAASRSLNLVGLTGRSYIFKKMPRPVPTSRVWLASFELPSILSINEKFILKDICKNIFLSFNEDIRPRLPHTPRVRLPVDTIPDRPILDQVSLLARKKILKAILHGIVDVYDNDINTLVEKVQISDFECVGHLPKDVWVTGTMAGNNNRRSPKANFIAALNKLTDLFSLGLVVSRDADFESQESEGASKLSIRRQLRVSCFSDQEGIDALMEHIKLVEDEDTGLKRLAPKLHWGDRVSDSHPYVPFQERTGVDSTFKDLVRGLNNLDPSRRFTAQALEHPWFEGIKLAF
ncbi:hypothetical protein PSV09DRAFT_2376529 [Bipolaris maydis]|nr:hypothetical protein J3E74DRAFT_425508 [Bipolaris maydis]KAJ6205120.1 hypothetical protein PSV09DRAFT_2376529 [Bipolaris maydis]